MAETNPMDVFSKEAPEVAAAFSGLIQSLVRSPGLDEKTKHLVYLVIKAAAGDAGAVRYHVPMALQLGATRDEIKDVILLTLTTSGVRGVVTCLPLAMDLCDQAR